MIKMIPNKNLDPNYNYLSDAIDATGIYQFKPEDYHFCDEEKVCNISININGKCYKDPDKVSNRLYNDLSLLTNLDFVDGKNKDYHGEFKYKHLIYNNLPFSSSYIGVLEYYAKRKALYDELRIGEFLNIFRTIGGHMIWPYNNVIINNRYTISSARYNAGVIYSRIDFILQAIKCHYLGKDYKHSSVLNKAINNECKWFEEYGRGEEGFKSFIDSFLLNDFVDKDYNVLSLVYDRPIEDSERSFTIIESRYNFDSYFYLIKFKIMNRSKRLCGIEI